MDGVPGVAAALGGLAQLASIASAFWLGGLLRRRARRASGDGAPERLMGLHLLLAIGAGSLLLSVATTSAHVAPLPGAAFWSITIAGNVATILGLMAALWFNVRVFHGDRPGGRAVGVVLAALMWIGFAGYVAAGGIRSPDLYGPASWPYVATMVMTDLWLVADALRFRGQLLRRMALGLADPLVVDRLLLWSLASLARVGLVLIAPILGTVFDMEQLPTAVVTWTLLLSSLLILTATVSLWLMLVPSAGYRRWVERRFARVQAG